MAAKVSILIDAVGRLKAFADARAALGALRGQAAEVNRALATGVGIDIGGRLTRGAGEGVRALTEFMRAGVRFNATLQETELGLAAIFKSVDRAGNFKTFDDAVDQARAAIVALNKEAAKSPFEFGELLEQFQLASPLLSQFGTGLKDQIGFVTQFSQVARVLMGDQAAFQAPQELRALLTGQIDRTARIAQILFPTDEAREALKKAVETGTVIDLLRQKFSAYSEGAARGQRNLNQIISNTKDSLNLMGKELTKPLFDKINAGAARLKELVESPALRQGLEPVVDDFSRLADAGLRALDALRDHPELLGKVWDGVKLVAGALAALAALAAGRLAVALVLPFAQMLAVVLRLAIAVPPVGVAIAGIASAVAVAKAAMDDLGLSVGGFVEASKIQFGIWIDEWKVMLVEAGALFDAWVADVAASARKIPLIGKFVRDDLDRDWILQGAQADVDAIRERIAEARGRLARVVADDRAAKAAAGAAAGAVVVTPGEVLPELSNLPLGKFVAGEDDAGAKAKRALEQAEELRLQTELLRIQQRRAMIEADRLLPADQQRGRVLAVLEEERAALEKVLAMWEARRAAITEGGPEGELARAQIDREIAGTMGDIGQIDAEKLRLNQEAFLETPMGQMQNWLQQMGTMSQQIGQALTQNIGTAIDGISNGISNMILGTGTWADAMRQTASAIIQSLVRIGVQMVVQAALGKSLTMASAATTSTAMATTAAAAAPAAAATSVASFGSSAILGSVAALAAIAAIIAAITGAFAEGGLVPGAPSRRDNRLAAVATGEYVVRTDAVSHYGADVFEAMNRMAVPRSWLAGFGRPVRPSAAFGFAGGGLVGDAPHIEAPKVNIAILNTRGEMREWMESAEGQRVAFDAVSKRTMELGVRG
jgi:hypothetical protein